MSTEQLAPETERTGPGDRGPGVLNIATRQAGVSVTESTALTLGAVWSCVRVITDTLASLPWGVHRATAGQRGRERVRDHHVDGLIARAPNPEMSAFQFREAILAHCLTWGNGYAEIVRDPLGRARELWLLTPDRVTPGRTREGQLAYEVINGAGHPPTVLEARNVLHLRGLGFDGLKGYSVINLAARSIGIGIAVDEFLAGFYANDSTPGGYLSHPGRVGKEARENIEGSWQRKHGGPFRRRTVQLLEEGMEWKQTSLPPEDAQLFQNRQFSIPEICRWFRVPPHKVADLDRATFSNIEQQSTDFVNDALVPWAKRLETEADAKLFTEAEQRAGHFTRHVFQALLRGDAQARSEFYTALLDRGVLSVNDVLELEDRNPIGPLGDRRYVMANMVWLEDLGKDQQGLSQPAPTPSAERITQALTPVVDAMVDRWHRKANRAQANALKKATLDTPQYQEWSEHFTASMLKQAREDLESPVSCAASLWGTCDMDLCEALCDQLAEYYAGRLRGHLSQHPGGEDYQRAQAQKEAETITARIVEFTQPCQEQ